MRGKITWVNSEYRDAFKNTLRTARGSINRKLIFLLCRFLMFLVRVLLLWDCLFWLGIPLYSQIGAPIYTILTEIFMKSTSTWYSRGSSWGDLPNAHEKIGWLNAFHRGKSYTSRRCPGHPTDDRQTHTKSSQQPPDWSKIHLDDRFIPGFIDWNIV